MTGTPWDMAVFNVLFMKCFISDEKLFAAYLKLLNAAFEPTDVTCILMDLTICWDVAKIDSKCTYRKNNKKIL